MPDDPSARKDGRQEGPTATDAPPTPVPPALGDVPPAAAPEAATAMGSILPEATPPGAPAAPDVPTEAAVVPAAAGASSAAEPETDAPAPAATPAPAGPAAPAPDEPGLSIGAPVADASVAAPADASAEWLVVAADGAVPEPAPPEGDAAAPADSAGVARHPVLYTNERDVWVTADHAVLPGRTLLLEDVQWVEHEQKGRSRTAKWTVAVGVLMLAVAVAGPLPLETPEASVAAVADAGSPVPWGILFLGVGLLVLLATRPRHEVLFLLHDGRTHLHVTRDEAEATQISQAVNRRIVEGGGSPNRFFRMPARP